MLFLVSNASRKYKKTQAATLYAQSAKSVFAIYAVKGEPVIYGPR